VMYNSNCSLCYLGETCASTCLPATPLVGDTSMVPSRISTLIVGGFPSKKADAVAKGFQEPGAQLLKKALDILSSDGLDLSSILLTYAVKCYPGMNKGKPDTPKVAARRACLTYFDAEVDRYSPEVIVCLGGSALSTVVPSSSGGVNKNRLTALEYTTSNGTKVPVLVTLDPYSCLVNPNLRSDFLSDLHAILINRVWCKEGKDIPVTLVNSQTNVPRALDLISEADIIGLDIETNGLGPNLLTIGVSI